MAKNLEGFVTFMLTELEQGSERGEAMSKVIGKWHMSERTFDRYWKIAKERYSQTQQDIQKAVADKIQVSALERLETSVLTKQIALEGLTNDFMELARLKAGNRILVLDDKGEVIETFIPTPFDEVRAKQTRMQIVEKMAEMEGWSGVVGAPASVSISNNVQNNTTVVSRSITFKTRKTTMQPQSIQDETEEG